MCTGGGGGSYIAPQPKQRWLQDTSNEIIVSKYELSDENKRRNALRTKARLLARRQLMADDAGGDGSDGTSSGTGGGVGVEDNGMGGVTGGHNSDTGHGFA